MMRKQKKDLFFDEKVLEKVMFERDGYLVDVILQNFFTKAVLFGASMRREDLQETIEKSMVVLWSKSRRIKWIKGEVSGNYLEVVEIILNCEENQLLMKVIPRGRGVCHTTDKRGRHRRTCFYKAFYSKKNFLKTE